jgi:hypothetical protein
VEHLGSEDNEAAGVPAVGPDVNDGRESFLHQMEQPQVAIPVPGAGRPGAAKHRRGVPQHALTLSAVARRVGCVAYVISHADAKSLTVPLSGARSRSVPITNSLSVLNIRRDGDL